MQKQRKPLNIPYKRKGRKQNVNKKRQTASVLVSTLSGTHESKERGEEDN